MSKLKQIWRSLFHKNEPGQGRYKAIIDQSYRLSNESYKTCVFAQNQDDIVPNVERRIRSSYADKIVISDVFYQASKGGFFDTAHLSKDTQDGIDLFNKTHNGHAMRPGL